MNSISYSLFFFLAFLLSYFRLWHPFLRIYFTIDVYLSISVSACELMNDIIVDFIHSFVRKVINKSNGGKRIYIQKICFKSNLSRLGILIKTQSVTSDLLTILENNNSIMYFEPFTYFFTTLEYVLA